MSLTRDALWQGRLNFWQPARGAGYRFNLDPVLLSGFVPAGDTLLDLGAGCGVLGMLLLARRICTHVTAVELQPGLAELCERNARDNGMAAQVRVVCGDLRELEQRGVEQRGVEQRFDRIVFNPPYFRAGHGHAAGDFGRDAARHERYGTLSDFVACAADRLGPGGSVCVIVPAARTEDLHAALRNARLVPYRQRDVCPRQSAPAGHVLLEARPAGAVAASAGGGIDTKIESPLVVHAGAGRAFTAEVDALLQPPPA